MPAACASGCAKPDGSALEAHEVELAALERIARGEHSAWDVAYGTVRLVVDGAHIRQPRLPEILLMDEVHAYSYRDKDTGKVACVFWACAYDGATGRLIDMIEGRGEQAADAWFRQFDEEERRSVRHFCCDMYDTYINAAKRWLGLACISVDRFHVAKAGVAHVDRARSRIQKGAGNGAEIKRRARKLVVNKGKRTREHPGEAWVAREREATCRMLDFCDTKHSHLRQIYLAMQLYYIWQDTRWTDRYACEKALNNWIQKAAGLDVPEMRSFAHTVAAYRQHLVTGTVTHVNSARAEAVNDKIKELKRKGRGFGGFAETRRRLILAFGGAGAVEGATARARRREAQRAALAAPKKRKRKR